MLRRLFGYSILVVVVLFGYTTAHAAPPAAPGIQSSGVWSLTLVYSAPPGVDTCIVNLLQTVTVLDVNGTCTNGGTVSATGVIDTTTGAFSVAGTGSICGAFAMGGTITPDGNLATGLGTCNGVFGFTGTRTDPAQVGLVYVVNLTADDDDGLCTVADCTLREAINATNGNALANTITFNIPDTESGCTAANFCTITLGTLLPAIDDDLTIDGVSNAARITVNGNSSVRVLSINAAKTVVVDKLTIEEGACDECGGGGIENLGTLTVRDTLLLNNRSTGGSGGAGAGIANLGTLTVQSSTFWGNDAEGAIIGMGGGIYNSGTLVVANSTFFQNSASGAVVGGFGGGILNNVPGTANITNSTIVGNVSFDGAGGVDNMSTNDTTLRNTLLADNSGGDCANVIADAFNIDMDGSCDNATTGSSINFFPIGDYGGPTPTLATAPGSDGIEAGSASVCAAAVGDPTYGAGGKDQRGVPRPQGPQCDVGAFETNLQAGPNFVVNSTADTDDGFCDALVPGITDCTLREAINTANDFPGTDTITFDIPAADSGCTAANVCTITLTDFIGTIQDSVTIDGAPNNGHITVSGDDQYQIFSVRPLNTLTVNQLTLIKGFESGLNGGGAIFGISANVMVTNSTFRDNHADDGGAIRMIDGGLAVSHSTFVGNSAGNGGAIFTGAVSATVSNSTFYNNSATGDGGALLTTRSLFVANSTLLSNNAGGNGGGVLSVNSITLVNTIIADSKGGNCATALDGTLAADSFNIDTDDSCDAATEKTALELNFDPLLLQSNGGPTQTIALLAGSAAIDAGDDGVCSDDPVFNLDQRGVTRPQGTHCDVGAFERQVSTAVHVAGLKAKVNKKGLTVVKWKTNTEAQLSGFKVWRKAADGEWQQVKDGFVQAKQAGTVGGAKYSFKIGQVNAGKAPRFKLQVMYLDGHSDWTEVVKTP